MDKGTVLQYDNLSACQAESTGDGEADNAGADDNAFASFAHGGLISGRWRPLSRDLARARLGGEGLIACRWLRQSKG